MHAVLATKLMKLVTAFLLLPPPYTGCHVGHDGLPQWRIPCADIVIAIDRRPSLLVGYLEAKHGSLELWLRDWRIVINVLKSNAMFFVKVSRRIKKSRAMQFLLEPVVCGNTTVLSGNSCHKTYPVRTRQTGTKEGSLKIGHAWLSA
jgi:hypothetical protein